MKRETERRSVSMMRAKTRNIAVIGLLFALALIFSLLESLLPPVPFLPPGVKLGLSNLVTMYCLCCLGLGPAYLLALLKAGFALITRGLTAALLSGAGGILSVAVMAALMLPKKRAVSVFLLSVSGAVSHNIGQLFVSAVWIGSTAAVAYLPALMIAGVVMGAVTGFVLRTVLPAVQRLRGAVPDGELFFGTAADTVEQTEESYRKGAAKWQY